jgi:hypothetical protein
MRLLDSSLGRLWKQSSSIALISIAISASFYNFTSLKAIASEDIAFQVPSGNIHCRADGVDLGCEIGTNNAKLPPKPKSCDLDWGNRFGMSPNGRAERACHGDTLGGNPKHPILSYGKTWRRKGFTCISKSTGLTCKNQGGHGWTLSKNKQQLF